MANNNIDRLFQEQLKNLEATPNKKVWNSIEAKLKNKKRRVLPFWWFSSGIAAIFVVGLLLFPFSKNTNSIENYNNKEIITTNSSEENINKIDSINFNKKSVEEILIAEEETNVKNVNKQQNSNLKTIKKSVVANNNNDKTVKKREFVSTKNAMKKNFLANNSTQINIASTKDDVTKDNQKKSYKNSIENTSKEKSILNETEQLNDKEVVKKTDFNSFINKKEILKDKKSIQKQWSVAPVFAVLNSNSFSNTSPIDNDLSNSTEGENSFSYGVQVAYKINSKWTVQSGIHLQEMNYTNSNLAVVNVGSNSSSSAVVFNNEDTFSFQRSASLNPTTSSLINTVSSNGRLSQNYGYIEIPIEVKYNFSNNNKIETQVVAGFSSLFLNKNVVNLNTDDFSKSGKASNLNNYNISGNLGFDVNYHLDKNWSLNLNPMIKAQLNTFSSDSNGFLPFNFGVYTGINYSF